MSSSIVQRNKVVAKRKGAIAEGLDADLLVLDEQFAVEATMIAGRWVTSQL